MAKFRIIPHTADMALRVFADNLETLFCHAAEGMMSLMTEESPPRGEWNETIEVNLEAVTPEELLINWLGEILFLSTVRGRLPGKFTVKRVQKENGRYKLAGEILANKTPGKNRLSREIKAATYHNLTIRQSPNGYRVDVVFDV